MEYCNFLQSSKTQGKTSLNDTKNISVFDKRFPANAPGIWSVLLASAKFSQIKIISETTVTPKFFLILHLKLTSIDLCFPEFFETSLYKHPITF